MEATKTFKVTLDVTRTVTVIIEAADELEARRKASNLEYKHDVVGEITHWVVRTVTPTKG